MKKDIETQMEKIRSLVVGNIQSVIDEINTEKNDTLTLEDFNTNSFFVWEPLKDFPPYGVSYYLTPLLTNPSAQAGSRVSVNLEYKIYFGAIIREDATDDQLKLSHRYLTMIIRLFNDKILSKVKHCEILDVDIVPWEIGETGIKVNGAGILMNLHLPF